MIKRPQSTMVDHSWPCLLVTVDHGLSWLKDHGHPWSTMVLGDGRPWSTMVFGDGRPWSAMVDHGRPWFLVTVDHGWPRSTVVFGHDRPWLTTIDHGFWRWSTMVFHGLKTTVDRDVSDHQKPWCHLTKHGRPCYTMVIWPRTTMVDHGSSW